MVDGAAALMGAIWGVRAAGFWSDERGTNLLDTGAPFYDVYETSDGKYISIGSIEPQFYAELLERVGLADEDLPEQMDRSGWPQLRERFTEVFASKTREEWCTLLEGTDVCFAPVLTMSEAVDHPHIKARHRHHAQWNRAACAGAALFAHARRRGRPDRPPGRAHRKGAFRVGLLRCRSRRTARRRCGQSGGLSGRAAADDGKHATQVLLEHVIVGRAT